MTGILKYHLT